MNAVERPYVTCSIAASLDGCIDDMSGERLLISSGEHFQYVDQLRAVNDAILVGAETVRRDNPSLTVKGTTAGPSKVTVVSSGDLDATARFFTTGEAQKIVYCPAERLAYFERKLSAIATIVSYESARIEPLFLLGDLLKRGVRNLLVEGGEKINTMFIQAGLVDELLFAVGPFFVGDAGAPRFVTAGSYPFNKQNRLHLDCVEKKGGTAVMRYLVKKR